MSNKSPGKQARPGLVLFSICLVFPALLVGALIGARAQRGPTYRLSLPPEGEPLDGPSLHVLYWHCSVVSDPRARTMERIQSLRVIQSFGVRAAPAVPAIQEATMSPNQAVAEYAGLTLKEVLAARPER